MSLALVYVVLVGDIAAFQGLDDGVGLGLGNHLEYHSSLGGSPDEELDKLHQSHAIMTKLLGKNFIYNSVKLQSGKYDIRDCASFVLMRLFFRKLKLREYQQLFAKRLTLSNPDDIASYATAILLM